LAINSSIDFVQDAGAADYDLPPPQSATAIMAKEATQKEQKGGKEEDEDLRWARDRTGWAPKFITEKLAGEDEEGTLLDHQTFLEGRLSDKLFGGLCTLHPLSLCC
jgi:hypothetical protein